MKERRAERVSINQISGEKLSPEVVEAIGKVEIKVMASFLYKGWSQKRAFLLIGLVLGLMFAAIGLTFDQLLTILSLIVSGG